MFGSKPTYEPTEIKKYILGEIMDMDRSDNYEMVLGGIYLAQFCDLLKYDECEYYKNLLEKRSNDLRKKEKQELAERQKQKQKN